MIRKDFIERLIEQVAIMLKELLNIYKKNENIEEIQIPLDNIYCTHLNNNRLYFHNNNAETLINTIKSKNNEKNSLIKIELLAQLLSFELELSKDSCEMNNQFKKLITLYEYIENNSFSYSVERNNKIKDMKQRLSQSAI